MAEARLRNAVGQARARGFLGEDVMGAGFRFDIDVRRGACAYIAGEETALINSIEGRRAEPRNKPPFPAQAGHFGKPTAINNVETLLSVLEILRIGGPAFAALGTANSTGTRLFCLSGCVARPGLYEHEFGATLREVIDAAGGVGGGRPLRAVLLGGAAGSFVGPEALDTPLTFEAMREIGARVRRGASGRKSDISNLIPDEPLQAAQCDIQLACGHTGPLGSSASAGVIRGRCGTRGRRASGLDRIVQGMLRSALYCSVQKTWCTGPVR